MMKSSGSGAFAVDVICVWGCKISTTEFVIKFPGKDSQLLDQPVTFSCNGKICNGIPASFDSDNSVVFAESASSRPRFPCAESLRRMSLRKGQNMVSCGNEDVGYVTFSVWVWDGASKAVVVDIDGTLTRSNIRGYVETVFLGTYDYIHADVVPFLLFLDKMGLRIVYLTARPRSHIEETRSLLRNMVL